MSKVVAPDERKRLAEYPGGIMFELGCHVIDLVVGALGKPQAVTPFAQHSALATDGLVDNMLAVFRYPHALASVKSSALEVEEKFVDTPYSARLRRDFHIQPTHDSPERIAFSQARDGYKKGYQEVTFPKFDRYIASLQTWHGSSGREAGDFPSPATSAGEETVRRIKL